MKVFVTFCGSTWDGCLLVVAETRNKARAMAVGSPWSWEYRDINSRRVPEYDKYFDKPQVIEANDELPDGAPDFYLDIEP